MEKHYFIGEGPEAEKLIESMLARHEVSRNARMKLKNDYGSDSLLLSAWGVMGYALTIIDACKSCSDDTLYLDLSLASFISKWR